ncbi:MAG: hypothetical protein U0559_17605 [Anaerolineae bacterium]
MRGSRVLGMRAEAEQPDRIARTQCRVSRFEFIASFVIALVFVFVFPTGLPAIAAGEVARASVGGRDAVVGVDVDVGVAA